MKKIMTALVLASMMGLTLGAGLSWATANNHYVNGIEGIKGASVPPPGFYYRMYNVVYTADEMTDQDGNELPIGFDVNVFAIANRFIWVTDKKLLGGDIFMDAIIPVIHTDLEIDAMGLDTDDTGLGDICLEFFGLSWHGPRYDAAVALSVWLPTGDFSLSEPASPGKGFTSFMTTFGGTWYLDAARTWSASFLGRYEIHSDKDEVDLTPGDDFHFEWGIGKAFAKVWEAGIAGYCQWQVTDDSGADAVNKSRHDRVFGIGPEIGVFLPSWKLMISLRGIAEFGAQDRSEGKTIALTLTKIF